MPQPSSRPVALITGASRGIGAATARALAPAHDLVLVARQRDNLDTIAAELTAAGYPPRAQLGADLVDAEDTRKLAQAAVELGVNVLVCNAGLATSAPLGRTDDGLWQQLLAINLTAPFVLARALIPTMAAAGWGRVVNIASTAGLKGYRYTAAYSASKAGLLGLTRALAAEFAGTGVTVNSICPGFTDTDLAATAIRRISETTGRSDAQARQSLERFSPLGRLIAPAEVASLVAYLCGPGGAAIHGHAMAIDGGETTL